MTLSIFSQLKLMNLKKSDHLLLKIILNYTIFNLFCNFSQTFKLTLPHKNFLNEKINQKNKRNSHANGASSIK